MSRHLQLRWLTPALLWALSATAAEPPKAGPAPTPAARPAATPAATTTPAASPAKDPSIVLKLLDLTEATEAAMVKKLEASVKRVRGTKSVAINKRKGEIEITYKPGTEIPALRKAVAAAGFTIVDPKPRTDPDDDAMPPPKQKPVVPVGAAPAR